MGHPLGQGSVDETPWPGGLGAAPGALSPASSGESRFVKGASSIGRPPSGWQSIAQWRSPRPSPVVLTLNAVNNALGIGAADPYSAEVFRPTQLSCVAPPQTPAGVVRVTYGVGAAQRVLELDVRSGSFQLPPVDFVSVEGLVYGLGDADYRVAASITPGRIENGARFTNTWRPTVAPASYKTEPVPFGARWMSLSCDQYDFAAGASLRLFQAGGPLIVQDYANTVFMGSPGQPIELASRSPVFLYNDDAAITAFCTVKFYLET